MSSPLEGDQIVDQRLRRESVRSKPESSDSVFRPFDGIGDQTPSSGVEPPCPPRCPPYLVAWSGNASAFPLPQICVRGKRCVPRARGRSRVQTLTDLNREAFAPHNAFYLRFDLVLISASSSPCCTFAQSEIASLLDINRDTKRWFLPSWPRMLSQALRVSRSPWLVQSEKLRDSAYAAPRVRSSIHSSPARSCLNPYGFKSNLCCELSWNASLSLLSHNAILFSYARSPGPLRHNFSP